MHPSYTKLNNSLNQCGINNMGALKDRAVVLKNDFERTTVYDDGGDYDEFWTICEGSP